MARNVRRREPILALIFKVIVRVVRTKAILQQPVWTINGVQVLDAGRQAGSVPEPAIPGRDGYPENPLMHLMYTSGSSGRPKGAEYTERMYCSFLNVRLPSLFSVLALAAGLA